MAVSQALRRLLRILELEEEQRRSALRAAQSELGRLERAMAASEERKRSGRTLIAASAYTGELTERLAGIEEVRAGDRSAKLLEPRIADQQTRVAAQEEAYLDKRVERRQTEALISKTESEEAIVAARRGQQFLDDWYLSRRLTGRTGAIPEKILEKQSGSNSGGEPGEKEM